MCAEIGRELGFDLALGTPVKPGPFFPPWKTTRARPKSRGCSGITAAGVF